MTSSFRISLLLATLILPAAGQAETELQERAIIKDQTDHNLFNAKFNEIEKDSASYLEHHERTSSGLWRLTLLNAALQGSMSSSNSLSTKEAILKAWLKAYPDSPSAHFAEVQLLLARADSIRGLSPEYEIDPAVVPAYQRLVSKAYDKLNACKEMADHDPRWYGLMLDIARRESWSREEFYKLALQAFEKHPLYYQNYFDAIDFITRQKQWTINEVEDFANAAVSRTKRYEGSSMYARIYWYASQAYFRDYLFKSSMVSWPKMKAGFDEIMEKYPDSWNLNNYAKFSCLAKDKETSRKLLQRIGSDTISKVWRNNVLEECEEMIYQENDKSLT
ncbi:MAG: hypothetical protein REI12_04040 [Pedobacter sp.]|nr:hypothetical protein [Pedobacter sp.]